MSRSRLPTEFHSPAVNGSSGVILFNGFAMVMKLCG